MTKYDSLEINTGEICVTLEITRTLKGSWNWYLRRFQQENTMYTIEEGILNALVCSAPNLKNWRYVTLEINPSIVRRHFFSIGHDIKTAVKIRNNLFETFSHTYQLLFYIVDAPTTFFLAWYQLFNTLVIEASRLCFQPFLYAGLQLFVPKCCPPTTVPYEETEENDREPSPGGW